MRRPHKIIAWLLSALLCSAAFTNQNAQKAAFPGTASDIKSPDGRYVIRNVDNEKQDPAHNLMLIDTSSKSVTKIYSYGRHVEVLWSPTSRAFIVNDFEGSDSARPVLFTIPWKNSSEDLRKKLIDFLSSRQEADRVLQNHHVYFSVQQWVSSDQVLCKVTGYGDVDPKGFTKHFIYKLGDGFRPAR